MKRIPVVSQVSEQPGQRADDGGRHGDRPPANCESPPPDEPAERRKGDDRDLRARPEPEAQAEAEQDEVATSDVLEQETASACGAECISAEALRWLLEEAKPK